MNAAEFLADIEAKPETLRRCAARLGEARWPVTRESRLLLSGMGSSWFAADTMARRLRRAGVFAVAEPASVEASLPADPQLVVVGITASGASQETLSLLQSHLGASRTVALTNNTGLSLPADHTIPMHADDERGGVACRSYTHTLVMLLQLEHQLTGGVPDLPEKVRSAADAVASLLDRRNVWLPLAGEALAGPHGCWLLAPAERLSNSLQGALMIRECPRLVADGCETGDWNHVDVYLTKVLDYRALIYAGSRFDPVAARWMRERGSKFVAVGGSAPGAEFEIRYPGDDDPIVALLTEVVVAELLAADWWLHQEGGVGEF